MIGTLGGGAGLVAIGFVARDFGTPAAWGTSAALFLLSAPAYWMLGRAAPPEPAEAASEPRQQAADPPGERAPT